MRITERAGPADSHTAPSAFPVHEEERLTLMQDTTEEVLATLRGAVLHEQHERLVAPEEARQMAEKRIFEATQDKLRLIKIARDSGATKSAIAQQLGIRNLGRVTKLIELAEKQAQA